MKHTDIYSSLRWRKLRKQYLTEHPLCVMCQQDSGRVTPATVVDHKIPHKGNLELMWSLDNLQALCKPHHDGPKSSQDRTGRVRGCRADGTPIDPNSHWNAGK